MEKLRLTPSQTVGPFFAYSLTAHQYGYDFNSIADHCLLGKITDPHKIYISGSVFDGGNNPITDAIIELWQCDAQGQYRSDRLQLGCETFKGFGRVGTGTESFPHFKFVTEKPGSINGQAPHINVVLAMRGSLHILFTRIYFSDERNDTDPVLLAVEPQRRSSLIAQRSESAGVTNYHFDIRMQGEHETVFFQV